MSQPFPDSPPPSELKEPKAQAPHQVQPNLWLRLLFMVLVAILMGVAQTVLHVVTLIQFITMLMDKGRPNASIAAFGASLGQWLSKAARFQTAQTEDKPWPWSPMDQNVSDLN